MVSDRLQAIWNCRCPRSASTPACTNFDGQVQDLSPTGVAALLAQVGHGAPEPDAHDEASCPPSRRACVPALRSAEIHRWNPLVHLANLDLACYDREYAPSEQSARRPRQPTSLNGPTPIEAAIESLDSVPAPVASGLLSPAQGSLRVSSRTRQARDARACSALPSTVSSAICENAAATGSPDASLGPQKLAQLLGEPEAMAVDLGRLEEIADAERARLKSDSSRIVTACGQASSRAK